MKKWLFIAILSCQVGLLTAQDSIKIMSTAAFLADFKLREIDAAKIVKPTFNFGINAIDVIDCRYDTLHLGSIYQDKQRNLWLCFANKQPLSQVITNTLSPFSDKTNDPLHHPSREVHQTYAQPQFQQYQHYYRSNYHHCDTSVDTNNNDNFL